MDQTRALKDMRDILFHLQSKTRISPVFKNILPNILSQRFPKRRHFQRVGQPRTNKITLV